MKLAELYSLTSGQKLSKIHTNEKFFPLPFSNEYLLIQPFSKPSKCYDMWIEVLSLIAPILEKNNIKMIQVGGKNEPQLPFCFYVSGQTNWGQLQYLIKNSKIVLCADSVSSHLAGFYNKLLVVLISNNFKECVSPFYGDKNKQIVLEPDRTNKNPSFMLDEGPNKQINEIKPEEIAKSVLKLLNFDFDYKFETLNIGNLYTAKQLESLCDNVIDVKKLGLDNLIMRMDINFNQDILYRQLQLNKCSIYTDTPIDEKIIKNLRHNIPQIIYKIKENHNPEFAKIIKNYRIPLILLSNLSDELLNPIKLSYVDVALINKINKYTPKEIDLKDIENNKIYIKSNRILLGRGTFFQSLWHYNENLSLNTPNSQIQPIFNKNLDVLWEESAYFYYLKKTD